MTVVHRGHADEYAGDEIGDGVATVHRFVHLGIGVIEHGVGREHRCQTIAVLGVDEPEVPGLRLLDLLDREKSFEHFHFVPHAPLARQSRREARG